MQHPSSLALLGTVAGLAAAAAGSLPRGVGPEYASYYGDPAAFACINAPSIRLGAGRVNDNTCDCPDGSDEPGTAACAYIDALSPPQPLPGAPAGSTNATKALPGFWCANEGHVGAYVPFSFVNDGVCDHDLCCDGSEEFAGVGGVRCPDRCAEMGREHRRRQEERRQSMARALKKRRTMVKEAQELRRQAEARLAALTDEVKALEASKAELQQKHADAQLQDRGRVVRGDGGGGKRGVLVGLAKARVNELRDTLQSLAGERDALRADVDRLAAILRALKDEYNPNFNDEGVKTAVKAFEDYAARQDADTAKAPVPDSELQAVLKEDSEHSGVNWAEFEDQGDDTDILYTLEAYLPASLGNMLHSQLDRLRAWLVHNGLLADRAAKAGTESHAVKAAREAAEAAERELQDKTKALETAQEDLRKDYGPSDIFRALQGRSTSIEAGEYTYELTWLAQTAQKSKKGHGSTSMGSFVRIDRAVADDEDRPDGKTLGRGERLVLRFDDGQACWNGPRRRTDVWLACAETDELWRVSEAEKCVYRIEAGTPAACEADDAPAAPAPGRDEL